MRIDALGPEEVFQELGSSPRGLTAEEANKRLAEIGPNVLAERRGTPLWLRFAENFTNLFALLLWGAALLAFVGGMPTLGWAVVFVIIVNAIFSFWQEFKAERATAALKKLLPARARVLRDGEETEVAASDLVPGDIVLLSEGDFISADARLVEEFELRTNNSTLTGESAPVSKRVEAVEDEDLALTDAPNLVFAGTSVAGGSGRAVVFATGMKTAFGRIAQLTQGLRRELSPLQKELNRLIRIIVYLALGLGGIFFVIGRLAGMTWLNSLLFTIGIITANVPEGLLPTVTLSLALGVQRMARRHALVKKLSSVETLGGCTVICTDKTGTLTQNEMTVRALWLNGGRWEVKGTGYAPEGGLVPPDGRSATPAANPTLRELLTCAALCNNARLIPPDSHGGWRIRGDPTEGALLTLAAKGGLRRPELLESYPQVHQLPFDSERKRMSTVHRQKEDAAAGLRVYVKGAPRETLALCRRILVDGQVKELSDAERRAILAANDEMARAALRVLALAYRDLPGEPEEYTTEGVEQELTFLGLAGMLDPPRPEVEDAVQKCRRAGIRIIMVTGDYGLTAAAIARKIGIVPAGAELTIITGTELEKLSQVELRATLEKPAVLFARVAPEHKMRVVAELRAMGEVVAVTGDGVNDAPALKRADIGVAMGITGTDVAKEAADIILTDDNFASIVNAVEEGRVVFSNIRKFITYIFAHLTPEAIPFIIFALFKVPLPLTVMQILAIDLGTETIPALALGTERGEPGMMDRPPRSKTQGLVDRWLLVRGYVLLGLVSSLAGLSGYFWVLYRGGWRWGQALPATDPLYLKATTMVFAGIVVMQIGNAFATRTELAPFYSLPLWSNRLLLWGIAFELAFTLLLLHEPLLQRIFNTAPLTFGEWGFLFAFVPLALLIDELAKAWHRRASAKQGR
ncbi:MAG TPA: cation-transporting P-type ATPase [Firmicutes bacterium]|nr:cation-transporting P-type ATPase [Bacillota bacterium]